MFTFKTLAHDAGFSASIRVPTRKKSTALAQESGRRVHARNSLNNRATSSSTIKLH
ncbi:hypothetical protein IG631_19119 [Alternaria alternata]|nr:hypothetical protein IG631_19119 [Alternaria alternata]